MEKFCSKNPFAVQAENGQVVIAAKSAATMDTIPAIHKKGPDKGWYVKFPKDTLDGWDTWKIMSSSRGRENLLSIMWNKDIWGCCIEK